MWKCVQHINIQYINIRYIYTYAYTYIHERQTEISKSAIGIVSPKRKEASTIDSRSRPSGCLVDCRGAGARHPSPPDNHKAGRRSRGTVTRAGKCQRGAGLGPVPLGDSSFVRVIVQFVVFFFSSFFFRIFGNLFDGVVYMYNIYVYIFIFILFSFLVKIFMFCM